MEQEKSNSHTTRIKRFGIILVRLVSGTVNIAVLGALLLCLLIGLYALWDSQQVYKTADAKQYEIYKPIADDSESFEELRQRNNEVIGWITVFGTGIDYPVVQADDNVKYLTTDVGGNFAASGSIYLDYRNNPNFEDFNSIIFGHHMAGNAMFGDVGMFTDNTFFNEHRYGSLYANGREQGLEFFAMLEIDAYNKEVYRPGVVDPTERSDYLELLFSLAMHARDVHVDSEDRIILLSTCTQDITNGRHVLAARLLEDVPDDPYSENDASEKQTITRTNQTIEEIQRIPTFVWPLLVLILLCLALVFIKLVYRKKEDTTH